mmetsp:Transcript_24296/g.74198  ORF Transcript_24296/g.74198 Transcript_24296/m.74198 type:complete len:86 (+) Transcript_24296:438-695(+)
MQQTPSSAKHPYLFNMEAHMSQPFMMLLSIAVTTLRLVARVVDLHSFALVTTDDSATSQKEAKCASNLQDCDRKIDHVARLDGNV